jgi:hypothetical protein
MKGILLYYDLYFDFVNNFPLAWLQKCNLDSHLSDSYGKLFIVHILSNCELLPQIFYEQWMVYGHDNKYGQAVAQF